MLKEKTKFYMTPRGHKEIFSERDHLTQIERPEVTRVVSWAAGNGDRSENADYTYGKKRLREIDRRLRFLNVRLNGAVVVDPLLIETHKVQFGATVRVMYENEEQRIFSIVGLDEIDLDKGWISYLSPIAKALIGKEQGDDIEFSTPKGLVELEILEVTYKEI